MTTTTAEKDPNADAQRKAAGLRRLMVDMLQSATKKTLVQMHADAYALLKAASLDDSPAILKTMSAIEAEFERRDIRHCAECGCPNGKHEPEFCSQASN
jgi:hypothetical protein